MNPNDLFSQFKNMKPAERDALLSQVMGALSPDQQEMVRSIAGNPEKLEKVQKNLRSEDITALLEGLSGKGDAADFLKSPRAQKRMRDLLR